MKSYRYYVEVTDTALGTSRTQDYTTRVAADIAACAEMKMAEGLGSAAVTLEVPASAPSVPGGFSASGVTTVGATVAAGATVVAGATTAGAAGGGISTAVLIAGGVAVAGGGVAVAVGAGGGGGGGGGDAPRAYQGPFDGQLTIVTTFSGGACSVTLAMVGTATATFDQASTSANAAFRTSGTENRISGDCQPPGPSMSASWAAPLTGSAGNLAARLQQGPMTSTGVAVVTTTSVFEFSGALSGGAITGTMTFTYSGQGQSGTNPVFTLNGSTTIPVTLR